MKGHRVLAALLAVVAITITTILCTRGPLGGAPPAAATREAAAAAPASTESSDLEAPYAAPPSRSAATPGPASRGESGVPVRVQVYDVHGHPAAGAEIHYANEDSAWNTRPHRCTTDAAGRAELFAAIDSTLEVHFGDQSGEARCEFDGGNVPPVLVQLAYDVTLHAQVLDGDDRPVQGVRVRIQTKNPSPRRENGDDTWASEPSDAAGRVTARHLQRHLLLPSPLHPGEARLDVLRQSTSAPAEPAGGLTLRGDELRGEVRVTLRTAPCGSIAVRVVDADGDPFEADVVLTMDPGESSQTRTAYRGHITFANLPLNQTWHLLTPPRALEALQARAHVAGPRKPNEVVAVDLVIPARRFDFRARFLRRDGTPFVITNVHGSWPFDKKPSLAFIDHEGAVRLADQLLPASITQPRDLRFDLTTAEGNSASVLVQGPFTKGKHDLGDVIVEELEPVPPLFRIELRLAGKPVLDRAYIDLWNQAHEHPLVATRRVGAVFEFYGPVPDSGVYAICRCGAGLHHQTPLLTPGSTHVVDLEPAAELIVRVAPVDISPSLFVGELIGPAGHFRTNLMVDELQFWFEDPPVGAYDLRLRIGETVVYAVDGLRLEPGTQFLPRDDSRIDLQGRVVVRALRVRSTAPDARLEPGVFLVPAGSRSATPTERDYDLVGCYPITAPPSDVVVTAEGHVPVRIPTPTGDLDVSLETATRIELQVSSAFENVRATIVSDAVVDPVLRAFDVTHEHRPEFEVDWRHDDRLHFAPGTILEFRVVRAGTPGPPIRVVVGTESPQVVTLP